MRENAGRHFPCQSLAAGKNRSSQPPKGRPDSYGSIWAARCCPRARAPAAAPAAGRAPSAGQPAAVPSVKIEAQHQSRLQQALSARVTPAKQRCSSQQVLPWLLQVLLKKLSAYHMNHAVKHSSYKNVKLLYRAKMTTNNKGVFVCLCLWVCGWGFL